VGDRDANDVVSRRDAETQESYHRAFATSAGSVSTINKKGGGNPLRNPPMSNSIRPEMGRPPLGPGAFGSNRCPQRIAHDSSLIRGVYSAPASLTWMYRQIPTVLGKLNSRAIAVSCAYILKNRWKCDEWVMKHGGLIDVAQANSPLGTEAIIIPETAGNSVLMIVCGRAFSVIR